MAKIHIVLFLFCILFSCEKPNNNTNVPPVTIDSTKLLPKYDHVLILILENKPSERIIGSANAPFINSLVPNSANFTESYAIEHPSQPNYLDLYSGSNQGVTDNNTPPAFFTTPNLGSQLITTGKSFTTYSESLQSVGYNGYSSMAGYARKHNPAANWVGTGANQIPSTTNQPFSAFPADYKNLPTISYVVPNIYHDMHDGTIAEGDTWVMDNLGGYITWAASNNSLFILTFDEDDGSYNNHISTLFLGQHVKTGSYSTVINHFTVLRTLEDLFKLPYAGAADKEISITNCWK
ncbi:MAG: alkaline phosphatase family protein [Chitinophagaceae bacterium]